MAITICNLRRLRRTAIRHGLEYTTLELDPATVNALITIAEHAKNYVDNQEGLRELAGALSVFDFEDR